MAEPALAGVRMVAVTVPGMGGTPAPEDLSIENLTRLAAQCAAGLGCDVVVGFSAGLAMIVPAMKRMPLPGPPGQLCLVLAAADPFNLI